MESKTIVALARIAAGAAIMITSMVTRVNGNAQMVSMFLMGVPFEALQRAKS